MKLRNTSAVFAVLQAMCLLIMAAASVARAAPIVLAQLAAVDALQTTQRRSSPERSGRSAEQVLVARAPMQPVILADIQKITQEALRAPRPEPVNGLAVDQTARQVASLPLPSQQLLPTQRRLQAVTQFRGSESSNQLATSSRSSDPIDNVRRRQRKRYPSPSAYARHDDGASAQPSIISSGSESTSNGSTSQASHNRIPTEAYSKWVVEERNREISQRGSSDLWGLGRRKYPSIPASFDPNIKGDKRRRYPDVLSTAQPHGSQATVAPSSAPKKQQQQDKSKRQHSRMPSKMFAQWSNAELDQELLREFNGVDGHAPRLEQARRKYNEVGETTHLFDPLLQSVHATSNASSGIASLPRHDHTLDGPSLEHPASPSVPLLHEVVLPGPPTPAPSSPAHSTQSDTDWLSYFDFHEAHDALQP